MGQSLRLPRWQRAAAPLAMHRLIGDQGDAVDVSAVEHYIILLPSAATVPVLPAISFTSEGQGLVLACQNSAGSPGLDCEEAREPDIRWQQ